MTLEELLTETKRRGIQLQRRGDELIVRGGQEAVDSALVASLRTYKAALLDLVSDEAEPVITPEMLPLVELNAEQIERIVSQVPGGAGNVQDIYPLAPLQEGILFHHLMAQQGDPYLLSGLMAFDNRERLDPYLAAMRAVIDRHDILRTAIFWEGLPEPVQVVLRKAVLPVQEVLLDDDVADAAKQLYASFHPRRFRIDLHQAPLLRLFTAYDRKLDRWLMLLLLHHLAGDYTSLDVMQEEIQAHLLGQQERLPAPLPFRNLVAQARLGISREEHEAFFRKMLGDVDGPTAPFGLLEVQGDGADIVEASTELDAALCKRMRESARRLGVSVASLCHLAWAQVLARVSGREDVVFGTVLFGRMQGGEGADRVMGPFINTLPLRIQIGERSARDSVRHTHTLVADLLRHEHASLALAQRCSAVQAPTPLFSSLLNYRSSAGTMTPPSAEALQAQQGMEWIGGHERTNYPCWLSVDDRGNGFRLAAQVDASVDPARVCVFMQTALTSLVTALEYAPETPLRSLDVMPADERQRVLYGWNNTAADFPSETCVHQLFEAQVERTPEATALIFEDRELSYGGLNRQANRLAHYLRELGVKPDDRVALCLERGFEMMVGLLAVLKAGGAYVPLDPAYPAERLRFMLDDSAPVALLTQAHLRQLLPASFNFPVLLLEDQSPDWNGYSDINPDPAAVALTPDHLAYVIYTSGSTGTPKGVMVEHRSLCNRLAWMQSAYLLDQDDAILQKTPFSFDVSVWEFFWPLLAGARLALARPEGHKDPAYLLETIRRERVTTLHFVPSMLQVFLEQVREAPSTLRRVLCSGEALPASVARLFHDRLFPTALYNLYGPTEATVDVTAWTCPPELPQGKTSIGRPAANTCVYILDAHGEPAPVGVAGELYIGGVQVARGYLNQPELTAERFLRDLFSDKPGARMYKTGDLGRWLADGNIEFLGRNDDQVKIRGFRIELGEIEARLNAHPAIREAVVLAREDQTGDKRLVAYYTSPQNSRAEIGADQLRTHLASSLPEYMLPAAYVQLESLPLMANGKLDRKALPAPVGDVYANCRYQPPQGETEALLATLWAEVLKIDRIGRHDNFFQLGGHSLIALRLIERMRQYGLYTDVRAFFAHPVLEELATIVAKKENQVEIPPNGIPLHCDAITPEMLPLVELTADEIIRIVSAVPGGTANVQDIYPLAPLQEGILFHHLMNAEGDPYLLTGLLSIDSRGRLDSYLSAMQAVVDRHDILRTAVLWEGLSQPVQVVLRKATLPVEELDFRSAKGDVAEQLYARFNPALYRMNVRQAPLLRTYIAHDPKDSRWLMLQLLHHLADDNTSLKAMQTEIEACMLGQQEQLPSPVPFRNLVTQARLGISTEEHEAFFRQMLADIEEPTAPFGLLDAQSNGIEIEEGHVQLDLTLARRLRATVQRVGVSQASLFHLAWAQVLARISARKDVVFGTVLFGRLQGERGSAHAIGMFVNTLPIRITLDAEGVLTTLLRTHALLSNLLRHEHAPLVLAQRCSSVPAPTPLFCSLLNYRHGAKSAQFFSEERGQAQEGITWLRSQERTNYPLSLSIDDFGEDVHLTVQVHRSIDPFRICEFMRTTLESIVESLDVAPAAAVCSLEVLPSQERQMVLYDWNDTAAFYPRNSCIHQLFEQQVEQTPEATAVIFHDQKLSYSELNRQANRLAHYLRELGVKPDDRVGLCVERGLETIVALLAILKAGGAYVPLDPNYPTDRLHFMLDDSHPVALLIQTHLQDLIPKRFPVLLLDDPSPIWHAYPDTNQASADIALSPQHLAYLIYTSGSTGLPKAVMVEHQHIVARLAGVQESLAFSCEDTMPIVSSSAFDISLLETLLPLVSGGQTHITDARRIKDMDYLIEQTRTATVFNAVTSLMDAWCQYVPREDAAQLYPRLRTLLVGGEPVSQRLLDRLSAHFPDAQIVETYGPTEATLYCTSCIARPGGDYRVLPPIGRPLANTRIYILDGQGNLAPIGVAGEIHIGGTAVARGYLNRPELTAQRFLKDPFVSEPGARMYKTGDLGRWLPDGNIEFLGRNDSQVKIRGFRIELGEIEARLQEHPGVREAVVLAREDEAGDKRLVAYYVPGTADRDGPEADVLRSHLSEALPEHMVPAVYVRLDALPLTPNGKLDRKALPAPDTHAYSFSGYEGPQGETEILLAGIFAEVLKLDRVGRHDNFFQLGGHSLLAVTLIERMRRSGVRADVRTLYTTPTLAEFALATEETEIAL